MVNAAEPTTDTSQSFAIPGLTRAQLLNGVFGVRVRATRGNSNTAFTASLDAVSVKVDYTAANVTAITVNATGATTGRGTDTFTYDQARMSQASQWGRCPVRLRRYQPSRVGACDERSACALAGPA